ncbi:hypothetical protein BIV59_14465 [Bacillus sp. MUM 13]|nr:hypothetical protein BIV59_14465 [Bacillus sp. MUM 13]
MAWRNGVLGKIAAECVFDNDKINEVTGYTENSWYAALPVKDIYISEKRPKIIRKLLKCCVKMSKYRYLAY